MPCCGCGLPHGVRLPQFVNTHLWSPPQSSTPSQTFSHSPLSPPWIIFQVWARKFKCGAAPRIPELTLDRSVIVKHQGKKYEVELDPSSNGETFKYQLFSLTGVEPERQKILIKGGQLKDETELSTLGIKPNQTLMMMGTPSEKASLIEKPKEKIRFLEDMTEAEVAQTEGAVPAGLTNLGNTCYMNATLQTLRFIPELQEELSRYSQGYVHQFYHLWSV